MGGFALLVVDVGLELAPGFVWLYIVDHVIVKRDLRGLPAAVAIMIAIAFASAIVSRSRRLLMEGTAQRYVRDLRLALFEKLARLPMGYFSDARTGDLMSRVSSDVEAVQEVIVNGTDNLLANFLRLAGVVVIFISLQPLLGIATVSPIFLVGIMLFFFNRQIKPLYSASRRQLGTLTSRLADSLGGVRVVKSFAREAAENQAFRTLSNLFMDTNLKAVRARANLFPWVGFVVSFTNTIMLGLGAILIVKGQFTMGGLVAYRTYGRFFYGPIDNLTQINDMVQRAIAAGTRIFEVLDAEETVADMPNAPALLPVRGVVTFENVSFRYAGSVMAQEASPRPSPPTPSPVTNHTGEGAPTAINHVSFTLHPGQRVAVVGPSGAGKSTLFALIQRFYDPAEGRVLIDGTDIRTVTQESLRKQVISVPQDTFLFAESVRENIRYGRPEANDDEVEAAARAANAEEFILHLSEGYDTLVGERGVKLSGGQRQRIAVARAFLMGGGILLLDEATSAVEPESERAILEALDRLQEGRTTLIATHRLGTIREADLILVIENGRLVEQGTHDELVARAGAYARLIGELPTGDADQIVEIDSKER
jgi:ABC-type multidrug transport system fused ATPase/permease subunit